MAKTPKRPRPNTHGERTLQYLETHRGITSMEAIELFGNTRLSSTIHNLRKMGYNIVTVDRECETRYEKISNFGEYRLIKDETA
jgi:hypothetical protein